MLSAGILIVEAVSVPPLWTSLGEGNGNPLQYFCLENPMDRGAWRLQLMGSQRVGLARVIEHTHTHMQERLRFPWPGV